MPNITVTVDDDVYNNARIAAALHKTTITQLVRGFLEVMSRQTVQSLASGCYGRATSISDMASTLHSSPKTPNSASKSE